MKDNTLTEYGEILTQIDNVPIISVTFEGCTNLTTAPAIPSGVTNMTATFYMCEKLSGVLYINANNLTNYSQTFSYVATNGTGLTVVVPNDTARQLLIDNSNYNSNKVSIVKELAG